MIRYLLLIALVSLIGCASAKEIQAQREKTLKSWVGHYKKEIILSWGPPSKTDSDGDGGEILTWNNYQTVYIMNRPTPVWTYTSMYVRAEGIIYYYREVRSPNGPQSVDVIIR